MTRDVIHAARVALTAPAGRSPAELAGHVLALLFAGTPEDQRNAEAFARTLPYRADLALWLDVALPPQPARKSPCRP